jgi:hypothetical protein
LLKKSRSLKSLHEKLSEALADDSKVCSAGEVYEHINNIRRYALFHGQNDLLIVL